MGVVMTTPSDPFLHFGGPGVYLLRRMKLDINFKLGLQTERECKDVTTPIHILAL